MLHGRCDAKSKNLDAPGAHSRSHEKTDFLINQFDPGILWDEYGIRGDVVVCSFSLLSGTFSYALCIAFYSQLPSSRYPQAPRTRYPPSTHQGCFQGPLG
jgi:hypothetical protein